MKTVPLPLSLTGLQPLLLELSRCALGASTARLHLTSCWSDALYGSWARVSETEGEPIQIVRLENEESRLINTSVVPRYFWV